MNWTPTQVERFQFQREMRLKALHKKNLVKAKKIIVDSITDQHTESDVWFLDQAIWREEHKSEYDFEKTVEGCEDP